MTGNQQRSDKLKRQTGWSPGKSSVAVIMISRNEAHNMDAVLDNIEGWAQEVFLVDSYSTDKTVDIALSRGVHVVQRTFGGFGDQWNFAINNLPISAPWTMKLDPDERLTPELKASIERAIEKDANDGLIVRIRLWFLDNPLPATLKILRVWRTGKCRCSDVDVNEHLLVDGDSRLITGDLEHHDSPNLHHWYEKQNRYTTVEAAMAYKGERLSTAPNLFGTPLERRMWLKNIYRNIPFRHLLMFFYCYFLQGAWRAGRAGIVWARLRSDVFRMIENKTEDMKNLGEAYMPPAEVRGAPHPDALQADQQNKNEVKKPDVSRA